MLPEILLELVKLAHRNDAENALQYLLDSCVHVTGAESGSIFLLRLSKSSYEEAAVAPHDHHEPRTLTLAPFVADDDPQFCAAIDARSPVTCAPTDDAGGDGTAGESRLLAPMVQDGVCLGVIDLRKTDSTRFSREHELILQFAADLALILSEKEYTLNLLASLHKPISYDKPHDKFLDEIMLHVAEAARMPYIILRRLSGDSLRCQEAYGINPDDPAELDIDSMGDNPPFDRAIRERVPKVEEDVTQPYAKRLLGTLHLQGTVQSFIVVPILVGDGVYGTLSFAVACPHSYTQLERHGLTMVANAVGVALTNYENFHKAQERVFEEAKISTAITAVDVAQSARHEAGSLLHSCQELLGVLRTLKITSPKLKEQIGKITKDLSGRLYDADAELQKIKAVTKPPARSMVRCRLDELWKEALYPVAGRLKRLDVDHEIQGAGFAVVAADYIRHAFLNLLLNSMDAFRDCRRKKGRKITITIDEVSTKAKDNRIQYRDNATGIDPGSLGPAPDGGRLGLTDIFECGITSKRDGSGYGLYLARKILTEHRGSIDLKDHVGGVVFDITIPKEHRG